MGWDLQKPLHDTEAYLIIPTVLLRVRSKTLHFQLKMEP